MAESEAHGGLQGILEKVEVLGVLSCFLLCEIKIKKKKNTELVA